MKLPFTTLLLFILLGCGNKQTSDTGAPVTSKGFTLMDPEETGVNFINEVKDEEAFNILTYRNFYNGGGVAIGDINNDSLPDIYFTANQIILKFSIALIDVQIISFPEIVADVNIRKEIIIHIAYRYPQAKSDLAAINSRLL